MSSFVISQEKTIREQITWSRERVIDELTALPGGDCGEDYAAMSDFRLLECLQDAVTSDLWDKVITLLEDSEDNRIDSDGITVTTGC